MTRLAPYTALSGKITRLSTTLASIAAEHAPAAFSSSLAAEDMVITDAILLNAYDIEIFTLDTGRLHAETLSVLGQVQARYGYDIRVYHPDAQAVRGYVEQFGIDAFYESIELR